MSVGIKCSTVTSMPFSARPFAASSPSRPPPITTARPPRPAAASMASTSATSRKVMTPGRSLPGTGMMNGSDPVATSSTSYGRVVPNSPSTVCASRSTSTTRSPATSSMPFCSYQSSVWMTMSANVFSPASTGESMMRL